MLGNVFCVRPKTEIFVASAGLMGSRVDILLQSDA